MDKKDTIYQACRVGYISMLIIYWISRMIFPIKDIMASTYALVALLLISVVFIGVDFYVKKRNFHIKYALLFFMYLVWTVGVLYVNRRYGVWDGLVTIGFLAIQFYVFYIASPNTITEIKKEVKVFSYVLCVCAFILAVIGIAMYFYEIDFAIIENQVLYSQGFYKEYGRAWGILISANLHTGTLALLTMCFSILNIILASKKVSYIFNIFNIVVQLWMLVLSGSRSTIVAAYVSIAVLGWYFSKEFVNQKLRKKFTKEVVRILFGVGSICVLIATMKVSTNLLPFIKKSLSIQDEQKIEKWVDKYVYQTYRNQGYKVVISDDLGFGDEIVRHDMEMKADMSNGRFKIWGDAIEIIKDNWLTGIGNNIKPYVEQHDNESLLAVFGHCHNTYLEVVLCSGVVGAIILFAFIGACIWKIFTHQKRKEKNNCIMGIFATIICALLIVIFFSEDVFFQMSLNSIVFWMMLGYIMRIISLEEKDRNSKYAFICETGLHVYNALKFVLGNAEECQKKSDIYIYHQFRNSHEYAKRIRESGIFNHVYEFKKYDNAKGIWSKFQTLQRLFTNKLTLKKYACGGTGYLNKQYEVLSVCMITQFSNNLRGLSPEAKIYFMEDGIGSYYMDIEKEFMSKLYQFINKYIMRGCLSYHPEKIFVNNLDFLTTTNEAEFCQMPNLDAHSDRKKVLEFCMGYQHSEQYNNKKYVYMTQPISEVMNADVTQEQAILECIGKNLSKEDVVIRVHPRQESGAYSGFAVDNINNFWELECENQLTENHVLISAFSTAQFAPKIVAQKEPYIIFLYKIFGGFEEASDMVARIQQTYASKDKIFIPETVKELEIILKHMAH